jgi:hypothetical protein
MDPRQACQDLANMVLPFAEKMLREEGGFCPYAGVMRKDGAIDYLDALEGLIDVPDADKLADTIIERLRRQAVSGLCEASALVFDAMTVLPSSGRSSSAIVMELEHRQDYAVAMVLPYYHLGDTLEWGETQFLRGERRVFCD